ncbi:auxin response factor 3-like isoform X2 [Solanum tuberosum]|uniref:auxin response factor 3-like isoform X2 n=1 Tax=Solanum tuberosum TaxID=4113 RepID=UPI000739FFCE|nr:PREDICTED: auxin response factor 3-like isoform X2 [Solanum tuberosum]
MLDCLLGGNDKKRWFSVDSNVLEKKQWHLCRLASPASSASAFGSSNFTSSTPSMVALMCMELWHACVGSLISLPKM